MALSFRQVIRGETVRIGYYSQMGMVMNEDVRVIDFVRDTAEEALVNEATVDGGPNLTGETLARQLLSKFQFPISRWSDRIAKLSGGEKRRLQLLWVLARRPNFLILDEPSNDGATSLSARIAALIVKKRSCWVCVEGG